MVRRLWTLDNMRSPPPTASRALSSPAKPSGDAINDEDVSRRDDGTLDRALDPAGRVRHEEMHEEAQVGAARDGRQRAREPRRAGRELQVRDPPRRWDAQA